MENRQSKEHSTVDASRRAVLPLLIWYLVNYLSHALNWLISELRNGTFQGKFAVSPRTFLGDHWAWSGLEGGWLGLWFPTIVIATLVLLRVDLSYRRAFWIGFGIFCSQLFAWIVDAYLRTHSIQLFDLTYTLSRIFAVFPGVMAAASMWRLSIRGGEIEA